MSASTETKAVVEKRGTTTDSAATRPSRPTFSQKTTIPISPPNQIAPAARWTASRGSARPRGEERAGGGGRGGAAGGGGARGAGGAGGDRPPPPRRKRASGREQLGHR